MSDGTVLIARQRPSPIDIFLVAIVPVILAAGYYMVFIRLPWFLVLGFVAGCALGAMAWQWPRIMGPVLIVLSIPALAYYLFLAYYDPDASDRNCSTSGETTSAYMAAWVRRAKARQIP